MGERTLGAGLWPDGGVPRGLIHTRRLGPPALLDKLPSPTGALGMRQKGGPGPTGWRAGCLPPQDTAARISWSKARLIFSCL